MFDKGFSFEPFGVDPPAPKSESEELIGTLNIRTSQLGSPDGHSDRVAIYSIMVGKHLDLTTKELHTLKVAAMLHDIGKVGISRSIVEKLGKLTEREFEIMRLHSTMAVRMIEKVEWLADCIPLIKHHHERFDGKGYPDGLSGHDIPLGARIIAVTETFDILVSDVSWRRTLSIVEAEEEIRSCAGTQFDPMIVELFTSLLDTREIQVPGADTEASGHSKTTKIN